MTVHCPAHSHPLEMRWVRRRSHTDPAPADTSDDRKFWTAYHNIPSHFSREENTFIKPDSLLTEYRNINNAFQSIYF